MLYIHLYLKQTDIIVGKLINPDLTDTATVKINHLFPSKMVFPFVKFIGAHEENKMCLDFQKYVWKEPNTVNNF